MDFAQGTNIPYEFRNANIIYGEISCLLSRRLLSRRVSAVTERLNSYLQEKYGVPGRKIDEEDWFFRHFYGN
jgi:hypothetical protein